MMLPASLKLLLPLLQAVGVDPDALGKKLSRQQVEKKFSAASLRIVLRLAKDGIGPASLAGTEAERQLIRSILFLLWRSVFTFKGAGHVADLVRDVQDDKIVAAVGPLVNENSTLTDIVNAVKAATLELTF